MTSNFNTNQRTREYSYKSQVYEDYPTVNISSVNYDTDNSLQDNNILSPRMRSMRRLDTQSMRSGILNDSATRSRDEFTIFGSSVRQKSERRSENEYLNSSFERSSVNPGQRTSFKNLPVKVQRGSEEDTTEYSQVITREKSNRLLSQPGYSSKRDTSFFDLVQSRDEKDLSTAPFTPSSEIIVPSRKTQIESMPQQMSNEDPDIKDKEISRLNKSVDRMNKKLHVLEENNKKLQDHLKNLLNERKQLLNQIENSEFEEIIEEEEIQKAKPNTCSRENITRIEYLREEPTKSVEVSHINCIARGRITLDDVPQKMLESFRNEILFREREIMEKEKKSLIETLTAQQKKQVMTLKAEYEAQKNAVQQISVQSIKKTHFNHIVSETNLQKAALVKPISNSVSVYAYPSVISKQCQCEDNQARTLLNQYISKTTVTKSQKSIIEKIIQSVENNDYESLIKTMDEALCKPKNSVGVNASPIYSSKTSNTDVIKKADVMVESNIIVEVEKPRICQESRGVLVKPVLTQRGCQPEDTFKFETGTMTDQIFCRSQGTMIATDFMDHRSPSTLDVDSVINKSTNRSESRKQIISHTSFLTSPTKDFVSIHERAISPRIIKPTRKSPIETVVEHVVEVKTMKNENVPKTKPVNVIEEVEHIIEKKTQQITSVLDSNKVPKKEVPTTIECWETIAHIKDGQVIQETETYHDRLESTDADEIKAQIDKYEQNHLNEPSPTKKFVPENPLLSPQSSFQKESTTESTMNFQATKSMFETNKSSSKLSSPSAHIGTKKDNNSPQDSSSFFNTINSFTEINKGNNNIPTLLKQKNSSIYQESKLKQLSEGGKNTAHIKEEQVHQKPSLKETTYKEVTKEWNPNSLQKQIEIKETNFTKTINPSNLRKPTEIKEIKVDQNISRPLMEEKSRTVSEVKFGSDNVKNKTEYKEIKVQKTSSSTPYQEIEEVKNYSTLIKPSEKEKVKINQSKPLLKETKVEDSEEVVTFEKSKKSSESKEIKIQPNFSAASFIKPSYESESRFTSGNSSNNNKEIKVQTSLSIGASGRESGYSSIPQNALFSTENKEFNVRQKIYEPTVKETTYHESEEIITTTTTSSRIPVDFQALKSDNDTFQTINRSLTSSSNMPNPNNSIGSLTSPLSFKSYSSKGRSNFSSSNKESFSFESSESSKKIQGIPITVKTSSSTESSGFKIPVNITSISSGSNKVTRLPINIINNNSGSSSITSSNSAFRSLSSNQDIPVTKENKKSDFSEVLLSETVFQNCSELLLWLKSVNVITSSTLDNLPSNLVTVSSTVIDWWVDVTVKVDCDQLQTIVNYLISTFSKNLLKYLIINLDQQGNSCLHYMIGHQMWDSYEVLDSTNLVDPNVYNTQGFTLLMVASTVKISSDNACNKLRKLAKNANVNLKSKIQGQTALFIAAIHNNSQTIQILYAQGADVNISDNNDTTPLMIASSNNNIEAVSTILSFAGVQVNARNKDGKNAADMAKEAKFTDLIEIFQRQNTTTLPEQTSSYSRVIQNSYSTMSYGGTRKL